MPPNSELKPLFVVFPFLKPFSTKVGRKVIRALAIEMMASGEPHIAGVGAIVGGVADIFERFNKK